MRERRTRRGGLFGRRAPRDGVFAARPPADEAAAPGDALDGPVRALDGPLEGASHENGGRAAEGAHDPVADAVRGPVEEPIDATVVEDSSDGERIDEADRADRDAAVKPAGTTAEEPAATTETEAATATEPTAETEPDRRPDRSRVAGPLESFMRHPILTILPLLLLAGGGVYLGTTRHAEYTARGRVNVGRVDVPTYTLQTVVISNQVLAASYARAIFTQPVVTGTARRVGVPPRLVSGHLSASPIPDSTLIQVEAKSSSAAQAVALANAGANELVTYVRRVYRSTEAPKALRKYHDAQAKVRELERRLQRLLRGGRQNSSAVLGAQVKLDTAQLEASRFAADYRAASVDPSTSSPLTLLAPAATAESDRTTVLERLIVIGAVAGLVLGLCLALLVTNWRRLRALRE